MADLLPTLLGLRVRGTATIQEESDPSTTYKVVFQGCRPEVANYFDPGGHPVQIRAHHIPAQVGTWAVLTRRAAMRLAMQAWHDATPEERLAVRPRAHKRGLSIYNTFISEWLTAHPAPLTTVWDGGDTTWDNLKTLWEEFTPTSWDAGATSWDGAKTVWL